MANPIQDQRQSAVQVQQVALLVIEAINRLKNLSDMRDNGVIDFNA